LHSLEIQHPVDDAVEHAIGLERRGNPLLQHTIRHHMARLRVCCRSTPRRIGSFRLRIAETIVQLGRSGQ